MLALRRHGIPLPLLGLAICAVIVLSYTPSPIRP